VKKVLDLEVEEEDVVVVVVEVDQIHIEVLEKNLMVLQILLTQNLKVHHVVVVEEEEEVVVVQQEVDQHQHLLKNKCFHFHKKTF